MPFHARPSETVEAWQVQAQSELTRLSSLTGAQLGAEILRRGFGQPSAGSDRTRIGLSNSLCPAAPAAVGGDDIDVISQYGDVLVPVLSALESAGLLSSELRGRSALRFYRLTSAGRSALAEARVEEILAPGCP